MNENDLRVIKTKQSIERSLLHFLKLHVDLLFL